MRDDGTKDGFRGYGSGPVIGTAAWSVPKTVQSRFATEGSQLSRYASVFGGVEINSTFYRRHRQSTYERWALSVPPAFRFAVKIPKRITHEQALREIDAPFAAFLDEIAPLGDRLGPLLCQLPPSLAFEPTDAAKAMEAMRARFSGRLVIEVRHRSWATRQARDLLKTHGVDRVLADPAPVWPIEDFDSPPFYIRLHGQPRMYYSSYEPARLETFAHLLSGQGWCIFDNTASGAAIENALSMLDHCQASGR